jgi:hypothetical protein
VSAGYRRLVLRSRHIGASADGVPAALYVMVAADGATAKVGALESAANADNRLRTVEAHHRGRNAEPAGFPLRLVVVAELEGLVLGEAGPTRDACWASVEHLESAMRLVLARHLGRLSGWPEWIHVDSALNADQWVAHVEAAWAVVDGLGHGTQGSNPR